MKKLIFTISIIFFSISSFCQSSRVINVDNALEFVEAIGSNRTIQLEGATIYLSDISTSKSGSNFRFDGEWDEEHELVIFDVSNLKIIGLGESPVKIITKPTYGNVLVFNNCNNILLENIDAGHGPEKGDCTGGVLNFSNSDNININNSVLFGSGIEGITAEKVNNLKCSKTIIRGCSYGIMTLNNCSDIEFNDCEFSDNKEFDLINLADCIDVTFTKCKISENKSQDATLKITNCLNIIFSKCIIENNQGYCDSKKNKSAYETFQKEARKQKEERSKEEGGAWWCEPCAKVGAMERNFLLNIDKSKVYINECVIKYNMGCYFSRDTESYQLNNCSFYENDFILGYFAN